MSGKGEIPKYPSGNQRVIVEKVNGVKTMRIVYDSKTKTQSSTKK